MEPLDPVCLNPFSSSNACTVMRGSLVRVIAEVEQSPVWAGRALALAGAITPLLLWAQREKDLVVTSADVIALLQFEKLCILSDREVVGDCDASAGPFTDRPEEVAYGIRDYLAELPGYRLDDPRAEDCPARAQHLFVLSVIRQALARVERSRHDPETVRV